MKIRQVLILVLFFLLCAGVVSGLAQPTGSAPPSHHHRGFKPHPPPATACTDGKNLYVVMGPKIFQYSLPDLTLKKTVELPKPSPPGNK